MFNFMLPAVTLLTQYNLIVFVCLFFLICEMAGLRSEFGKRSKAFPEERASPSFLASCVCSTSFSPLLYLSHYPSFSPFPAAEETGHLRYLRAFLSKMVEDRKAFIEVGNYSNSLSFKLSVSG